MASSPSNFASADVVQQLRPFIRWSHLPTGLVAFLPGSSSVSVSWHVKQPFVPPPFHHGRGPGFHVLSMTPGYSLLATALGSITNNAAPIAIARTAFAVK